MHGSPPLLSLPTFSNPHQLDQIPIDDNNAAAVDDDALTWLQPLCIKVRTADTCAQSHRPGCKP